ncbi:MAG: KpsF/GutQ family sugar-phosphate isomerase [Bacteroidota bacterium]|jgi:arabinose-5-phosphate isomerase
MKKQNSVNQAKIVLKQASLALNKASENLNEDFTKAIDLLCASDNIFVSGIGKSGLVARKIASTMASYGLLAVYLHPVEALHGDIGIIGGNDAVILLSKSGSTEEIIKIVPFLKSRNTKIISIIGNLDSFLAYNSDAVIDASVDRESCPFNIAPTTSTTVAMGLGDALAVCCAIRKNVEREDFVKNHPLGQIGRNLTLQVKDVMHKNKSVPVVFSGASFREALIEITNKQLGCVVVLNKNRILKGIITDGDVRRIFQKYDNTREIKVDDIMSKNPATVMPDVFLGEALSLMETRESQISVLPVIDGNKKCIGIIRVHDIVKSGI